MSGLDVNELQAALNFHIRAPAIPLIPDGTFGRATEARVRDFQQRSKLTVDGIVGSKTVPALYRVVRGAVDVQRRPRTSVTRTNLRSLNTFRPVVRQLGPGNLGVVPPQSRTATSTGFMTETKLVFNPFAKPSHGGEEGGIPIQLSLSQSIPWPVSLPEPVFRPGEPLEVNNSAWLGPKFELEGKIKVPFKIVKSERVELKSYFFIGAGVEQNCFREMNLGGGTQLQLTLFKDVAGTGANVGLQVDGGIKWFHDFGQSAGAFKGYGDGQLFITLPIL